MTKICAPSLSVSREIYAKNWANKQLGKNNILNPFPVSDFASLVCEPIYGPCGGYQSHQRLLEVAAGCSWHVPEISVLNFWVSCTGEMEKGESNNTQLFHKRNVSNYLIHRLLRWITELPAEKEMYFLGSLSNASIHLKFSVTAILRKVFCVYISATNCTAALLSKLLKCVTKVVLLQHSSPGVKSPGYQWCRQLCL